MEYSLWCVCVCVCVLRVWGGYSWLGMVGCESCASVRYVTYVWWTTVAPMGQHRRIVSTEECDHREIDLDHKDACPVTGMARS